jgi:hypothetical protein
MRDYSILKFFNDIIVSDASKVYHSAKLWEDKLDKIMIVYCDPGIISSIRKLFENEG